MKNTKNIEIDHIENVPGTHVVALYMKDGTRYFQQRTLYKGQELFPGENNRRDSVIASLFLTRQPDEKLKYARVWYDKAVYIHEKDVLNYILERQGNIEAHKLSHIRGQLGYWTVEAKAVIKKLFGICVSTDGRHDKLSASKEIENKFYSSPKLRYLHKKTKAIYSGLRAQRTLCNYWEDLVEAQNAHYAWKLQQKEG